MALSLSDIPRPLLETPNKLAFIKWLASIPINPSSKRRLASVYSHHTGLQFTAPEYTAMLSNPLR